MKTLTIADKMEYRYNFSYYLPVNEKLQDKAGLKFCGSKVDSAFYSRSERGRLSSTSSHTRHLPTGGSRDVHHTEEGEIHHMAEASQDKAQKSHGRVVGWGGGDGYNVPLEFMPKRSRALFGEVDSLSDSEIFRNKSRRESRSYTPGCIKYRAEGLFEGKTTGNDEPVTLKDKLVVSGTFGAVCLNDVASPQHFPYPQQPPLIVPNHPTWPSMLTNPAGYQAQPGSIPPVSASIETLDLSHKDPDRPSKRQFSEAVAGDLSGNQLIYRPRSNPPSRSRQVRLKEVKDKKRLWWLAYISLRGTHPSDIQTLNSTAKSEMSFDLPYELAPMPATGASIMEELIMLSKDENTDPGLADANDYKENIIKVISAVYGSLGLDNSSLAWICVTILLKVL
jgi:hypothetical protein